MTVTTQASHNLNNPLNMLMECVLKKYQDSKQMRLNDSTCHWKWTWLTSPMSNFTRFNPTALLTVYSEQVGNSCSERWLRENICPQAWSSILSQQSNCYQLIIEEDSHRLFTCVYMVRLLMSPELFIGVILDTVRKQHCKSQRATKGKR